MEAKDTAQWLQVLGLTLEDLSANRAGRVSETQMKKLKGARLGAIERWLVFTIASICAVLAGLVDALKSPRNYVWLVVILLGAAVLVVYGTAQLWAAIRDVQAGTSAV